MPNVNVPHFSYPFRWDMSGSAVVLEQSSLDDITSCVTLAAKTPRGSRLYVPDFGIDDPTFSNLPLDRALIEEQLRQSEPRATIVSSETINGLIDTLVIGVGKVE